MRMSEAEQEAAALPPKLTVPMILFFLPVLFVVILGRPRSGSFGSESDELETARARFGGRGNKPLSCPDIAGRRSSPGNLARQNGNPRVVSPGDRARCWSASAFGRR